MKQNIVALIVGILFGFGLAMSEMLNPEVVIGFLDVTGNYTGAWNPQLLLVMAGGLIVTLITFPIVLKQSKPVCEKEFQVSTNKNLDAKLISGAVFFGVGWGLAGICPGPAVAGLATGRSEIFVFLFFMLLGMATYLFCEKVSASR